VLAGAAAVHRRRGRKAVSEMIRTIVVIVLVSLSCWAALAHDFYPQECCSGKDCSPIKAERVRVTGNGYLVDGFHLVPFARARWSPDEHYHACWPSSGRMLGCFFAPQRAM
jgi:hypothetical protein